MRMSSGSSGRLLMVSSCSAESLSAAPQALIIMCAPLLLIIVNQAKGPGGVDGKCTFIFIVSPANYSKQFVISS